MYILHRRIVASELYLNKSIFKNKETPVSLLTHAVYLTLELDSNYITYENMNSGIKDIWCYIKSYRTKYLDLIDEQEYKIFIFHIEANYPPMRNK